MDSIAKRGIPDHNVDEVDAPVKIIQDRLLDLIDANPNQRLKCTQAPQLFREKFGTALDCKSLGHKKLKSLIDEMPRVSMNSEEGPGFEYLCRVVDESAHARTNDDSVQTVEDRLLELIDASSKQRLACNAVVDTYQKQFGTVLDYRSLGHPKLKCLVDTMLHVSWHAGAGLGSESLCRADSANEATTSQVVKTFPHSACSAMPAHPLARLPARPPTRTPARPHARNKTTAGSSVNEKKKPEGKGR